MIILIIKAKETLYLYYCTDFYKNNNLSYLKISEYKLQEVSYHRLGWHQIFIIMELQFSNRICSKELLEKK